MKLIRAVLFLSTFVLCPGFSHDNTYTRKSINITVYQEEVLIKQADIPSSNWKINREKLIHFVTSHGYQLEEVEIHTTDGHPLLLHHLTYTRGRTSKPPILLQHGVFTSSVDFLVPARTGLAYVLLEAGYDVWLANNRGSAFSCTVNRLNSAYWNFRLSDLIQFDFPAAIQSVCRLTGFPKVLLLGHSYGAAQALMIPSSARGNVAAVVALAPTLYRTGIHKQCTEMEVKVNEIFTTLELISGAREKMGSRSLYVVPGEHAWKFCQPWCDQLWNYVRGTASEDTWRQALDLLILSTSTNIVREISNHMKSGITFPGFGIGEEYRQLNQINNPVHIFYSYTDIMVSAEDILRTVEKIPGSTLNPVYVDNFNHMDFLWGSQAKDLVFVKILEVLGNYGGDNNSRPTIVPVPPGPIITDTLVISRRELFAEIIKFSTRIKWVYDLQFTTRDPEDVFYFKIIQLINGLNSSPNDNDCQILLGIITRNIWFIKYSNDRTNVPEIPGPGVVPPTAVTIVPPDQTPQDRDLQTITQILIEFQKRIQKTSDIKTIWDQYEFVIFGEIDTNIISIRDYNDPDFKILLQNLKEHVDYWQLKHIVITPEMSLASFITQLVKIMLLEENPDCVNHVRCQTMVSLVNNNGWVKRYLNEQYFVKIIVEYVMGNDFPKITPVIPSNPESFNDIIRLLNLYRDYLKTNYDILIKEHDPRINVIKKIFMLISSLGGSQSCDEKCQYVTNILKVSPWLREEVSRIYIATIQGNDGTNNNLFLDKSFKVLLAVLSKHFHTIKHIFGVDISEFDGDHLAYYKVLNILKKIAELGNSCSQDCIRIRDLIRDSYWYTTIIRQLKIAYDNNALGNLIEQIKTYEMYFNEMFHIWFGKPTYPGTIEPSLTSFRPPGRVGPKSEQDILDTINVLVKVSQYNDPYFTQLWQDLLKRQLTLNPFNIQFDTNESLLSFILKLVRIYILTNDPECRGPCLELVTLVRNNNWSSKYITKEYLIQLIYYLLRNNNTNKHNHKCTTVVKDGSYQEFFNLIMKHKEFIKNKYDIYFTNTDTETSFIEKIVLLVSIIEQQGTSMDTVSLEIEEYLLCYTLWKGQSPATPRGLVEEPNLDKILQDLKTYLDLLSTRPMKFDSYEQLRLFITNLLKTELLAETFNCGPKCSNVVEIIHDIDWYRKHTSLEYLLKDIYLIFTNVFKQKPNQIQPNGGNMNDILNILLKYRDYLISRFNIYVTRNEVELVLVKKIYVIISTASTGGNLCDDICKYIIGQFQINSWLSTLIKTCLASTSSRGTYPTRPLHDNEEIGDIIERIRKYLNHVVVTYNVNLKTYHKSVHS